MATIRGYGDGDDENKCSVGKTHFPSLLCFFFFTSVQYHPEFRVPRTVAIRTYLFMTEQMEHFYFPKKISQFEENEAPQILIKTSYRHHSDVQTISVGTPEDILT